MSVTIMDSWGFIAAMALGMGNKAYRIQAMYVEFENLADPGDVVTLPAVDPAEGLEYYDDLAVSATRDYLRVPLLAQPTLGIAAGYESEFTEGESGNKLTFYAQTQGVEGVHGKTYSDSVNSKVYGIALVATPVYADQTQDVILVRAYLDAADQVEKLPSSQVGLTLDVPFTR